MNDSVFSNNSPRYPEKRFISLLVTLGLLIVLIGYLQRLDALSSRGDSFSPLAFQTDMMVKISYAYERLAEFKRDESTVDAADFLKRRAIKAYQEVVQETPIPRYVRRYIILKHDINPLGIEKAIQLLEETAARPEYSKHRQKQLLIEADMWRSIYLKPGVPRPDVPIFEHRINNLHLGWYAHLALRDLYRQAGLDEQAKQQQMAALNSAGVSAVILFGVFLCALAILFVGLVILVAYIDLKIRSRALRTSVPIEIQADPSVIAGYLLEVFITYLIVLLASQLIGGVLLGTANFVSEELNPAFAIAVTAGTYVFGGLVALAYLSFRLNLAGWSWKSLGLNVDNFGRNVLFGIGGYCAALPLVLAAGYISQLMERYIRSPENPVLPLCLQADTIIAKMLLFLLVAVAAPFFEELFFRGVLFTGLRARWGVNVAVVVSAIIFASIHPFPIHFLPIFVLGTAFAILMYERGSLISSMVAHALQNSAVFLLLVLVN